MTSGPMHSVRNTCKHTFTNCKVKYSAYLPCADIIPAPWESGQERAKGATHAEGERDQHLWGNGAREITRSEKED